MDNFAFTLLFVVFYPTKYVLIIRLWELRVLSAFLQLASNRLGYEGLSLENPSDGVTAYTDLALVYSLLQ